MAAHFSDTNFKEEVLDSKLPVLVDFYAEWCGPCKLMSPAIEKLAEEYMGKFTIGKLDIEANPDRTVEFGITSIPTLIFFKEGKIVEKIQGFKSEEFLRKQIQSLL